MNHRPAATLVEVLVAIFVTAIGLLALLVLFPLGALSMAQAIKDSRAAHAAHNAERIAVTLDARQDPEVVANNYSSPPPTPIVSVFEDPNAGPIVLPSANPDGPGYPVYLDPVGWYNSPSTSPGRYFVGGTLGLPRRSMSFINNIPNLQNRIRQTLNWFSLLDDLTFLKPDPANPALDIYGGLPCPPPSVLPGNNAKREGRYSWGYLLRRPRASDASFVNLTVVVYSQRPLQLSDSFTLTGEPVYPATGSPSTVVGAIGQRTLTIAWTPGFEEKPPIRRGSWILDTTTESQVLAIPGPPPTFSTVGTCHGVFYRVVNYVETGNTIELELQDELKHDINTVTTPTFSRTAHVVVMENVVEVFEKGTGWSQ